MARTSPERKNLLQHADNLNESFNGCSFTFHRAENINAEKRIAVTMNPPSMVLLLQKNLPDLDIRVESMNDENAHDAINPLDAELMLTFNTQDPAEVEKLITKAMSKMLIYMAIQAIDINPVKENVTLNRIFYTPDSIKLVVHNEKTLTRVFHEFMDHYRPDGSVSSSRRINNQPCLTLDIPYEQAVQL